MITVYHNLLFLQYQSKQPDRIPRLLLETVAMVDTGKFLGLKKTDQDDLNKAFELTNHIEKSWTENEGVTPYKMHPRSSSVGDVFQIWEAGSDIDKHFMVCNKGFKEVTVIERKEMEEMFINSDIKKFEIPKELHESIARMKQLLKDNFDKYIEIK